MTITTNGHPSDDNEMGSWALGITEREKDSRVWGEDNRAQNVYAFWTPGTFFFCFCFMNKQIYHFLQTYYVYNQHHTRLPHHNHHQQQ